MSDQAAVTIDFHDTLFICDAWFELEVRQLLPSFLRWQADQSDAPFDHSLAETAQQQYRNLRREIMEHGREQDAASCIQAVLDRMGLVAEPTAIKVGLDELMRDALAHAYPRPGAAELVRDLSAGGVRLAVVSNAIYHDFLEWSLAAHGLDRHFAAVVSSARTGYYKSRPEIYLTALQLIGGRPERAFHVGDSYRYDVLGAARAGMGTVWLDVLGEATPDHRADIVTDRLDGLAPRILAALGLVSAAER